MNPYGWTARTIRCEAKVSAIADDACEQYERFGDAFDGLQWLLARNPKIGTPEVVEGVTWWLHRQLPDQIAETPEIWVLYQVFDHEVRIYDLKVITYNQ